MKLALAALALGLALPNLARAEECQQPVMANAADYTVAMAKRKSTFQDDSGKHIASYILRGDEVLVVSQKGALACVDFATLNSETSGWLPLADLGPLRRPMLKPSDWNGKFQRDILGSYVELKPLAGNVISATGEAYWAMSLEMAKKGGLNMGDIGDRAEIKNGIAQIGAPQKGETDCSVDLRLLSKHYLLVAKHTPDDGSLVCWGHNVTFDGLYVRVKK